MQVAERASPHCNPHITAVPIYAPLSLLLRMLFLVLFSAGCGDPHFIGAHGVDFDFHGRAGEQKPHKLEENMGTCARAFIQRQGLFVLAVMDSTSSQLHSCQT